jgi:hypothetical protein
VPKLRSDNIFLDASFDKKVQVALSQAKKVRRALREEEENQDLSGAPSQPESTAELGKQTARLILADGLG